MQLSASSVELVSLEEALARIEAQWACRAQVETRHLDFADGATLAETIIAQRHVPGFDNAAVDGFAFNFDEWQQNPTQSLSLAGTSRAGDTTPPTLPNQSCMRVLTGAPLPERADTVQMFEDAQCHDHRVTLASGLKKGDNCRQKDDDISKGETLLTQGEQLTPPRIGMLASLGLEHVQVRKKLRVGILSTGAELIEPTKPTEPTATLHNQEAGDGVSSSSETERRSSATGRRRIPHRIYDSNRPQLRAALARLGCTPIDFGLVPDSPTALEHRIDAMAEHCDAAIVSAGMSTGEADHVAKIMGKDWVMWRLAIKPGRPVGLGNWRGRLPLLGLPGNPVAANLCFLLIGIPLLHRLGGVRPKPFLRVPAQSGFNQKKKPGRLEYVRVRLKRNDALGWTQKEPLVVERYGKSGAGVLSSVAGADGLAALGAERTSISVGDPVDYIPFSQFWSGH